MKPDKPMFARPAMNDAEPTPPAAPAVAYLHKETERLMKAHKAFVKLGVINPDSLEALLAAHCATLDAALKGCEEERTLLGAARAAQNERTERYVKTLEADRDHLQREVEELSGKVKAWHQEAEYQKGLDTIHVRDLTRLTAEVAALRSKVSYDEQIKVDEAEIRHMAAHRSIDIERFGVGQHPIAQIVAAILSENAALKETIAGLKGLDIQNESIIALSQKREVALREALKNLLEGTREDCSDSAFSERQQKINCGYQTLALTDPALAGASKRLDKSPNANHTQEA
jgi:hypothetical protein